MNRQYIKVISKFFSVGLFATAIHALVYGSVVHFLKAYPQTANLTAYLCAVSFSYYFQMRWTFSHRNNEMGIKSLSKFITTSLLGFVLNAIFVFVVDTILVIDSLYALFGIVFITPFITFILLNFWVFSESKNIF